MCSSDLRAQLGGGRAESPVMDMSLRRALRKGAHEGLRAALALLPRETRFRLLRRLVACQLRDCTRASLDAALETLVTSKLPVMNPATRGPCGRMRQVRRQSSSGRVASSFTRWLRE